MWWKNLLRSTFVSGRNWFGTNLKLGGLICVNVLGTWLKYKPTYESNLRLYKLLSLSADPLNIISHIR